MTGAIRFSLLRIYRDTPYRACGVSVRIGRRCAGMDALLRALGGRRGAFITAWNPRSRPLPVGINRRRQQTLTAHLRRFRNTPASGGLGRWHEEMMLVAADPRVLAVVARRFGQNAIVAVRANLPARLMLLI